MNKNYTIISDLVRKPEIEDTNLIIVEDAEDTKQATVLDLKKSLSGDYKSPSDKTFYSSQKIESYMNDIKRELSTFASDKEVKAISQRVEAIVASNGTGKDSELVSARDGEDSLKLRLERDISNADDKYMEKVSKVMEGTEVSTGNFGYIDVFLNNMSSSTTNINFKSKNLLNTKANVDGNGVTYTDTGFKYQPTSVDNLTVSLKFASSIPKGKYFFFANIVFDALFKDKENIKLALVNSKDTSAYTEFEYNQPGKFEFEAPKAFNEIRLIFNKDNYLANALVEYKNIMLMTDDKYENDYIAFEDVTIAYSKGTTFRVYNNDYTLTCSDANASIVVVYYDNEINAEVMWDSIKELQTSLNNNGDKCGLIEDYGSYLFFDDFVSETPTSCRLSYDDKFARNNKPSLKMTFAEDVDVNPVLSVKMTEYIQNIDSVSLVFYIDRTVSYYFNSSEPITIYLCSDSYSEPEMVNYFSVKLNKKELVQGWNIIKKNINEFSATGVPNSHGIRYIKIEVAKDAGLDNKSMYFNSVVFNQKMKPTLLLAFDGIYEEGIDYTYPYLTNRGIPATILANNRSTFSNAVLNAILDLRARYGWDIGQYGCNPNKELLTYDDNAREQYLALKIAKEWLQTNLVYDPISYSAPFGNLRPITVPLLKDLGYKIAKTDSIGYCNFFDPKYDFAIPMQLFSNNTTEDEIIDRIQYAIDNDCCVCLYTNNVTNYGNEADSKKVLLESIVKFISENEDKINVMTFSDFYNKCNS